MLEVEKYSTNPPPPFPSSSSLPSSPSPDSPYYSCSSCPLSSVHRLRQSAPDSALLHHYYCLERRVLVAVPRPPAPVSACPRSDTGKSRVSSRGSSLSTSGRAASPRSSRASDRGCARSGPGLFFSW